MIGEVIDRRYRIDAELGSGGMGVVYRATHTLIGKQVAIKVLRSQHARDEEAVQRFLQEARLASAIEHPHVVDLSDFGQLEDGRLYYVMELLEGRSLATEIDVNGPLSANRALRVALQVARGLGAAHAQGIVHRDLKPDNIFLCRGIGGDDHVKLFDFGIARAGDSRLTRPGAVLGTPEYMPPEQTMGTAVDGRADLYALGVILFEMLAGRVPLQAADVMEIFQLQLSAAPPRLAEVAPALAPLVRTQALLDRLLAKRADDRPSDAEAVQHALLDAIAGEAPQDVRRTTKAMGSGGASERSGAVPATPRVGSQHAEGWVAPASLAALSAPKAARPTPAYEDHETTTPLGSAVAAALAMPRPGEAEDGSRMSSAPTLAMVAAPKAAPVAAAAMPEAMPEAMPGSAPEAAPRVTQPQSLVLTPGRGPAPVPVAVAAAHSRPIATARPARRPSSWVSLTIGSAIAAGVLTVGGVGISRLRSEDAETTGPAPTPAQVLPAAAVAAPVEVEPAAPAEAPSPDPRAEIPADTVAPAADPDPPSPVPEVAAAIDERVGTSPTPAVPADPNPREPTAAPTQGKHKARAKKNAGPSSKPGSDAPASASKAAASTKPKADEPGPAPAADPTTIDEPKRTPKRSIDLKDPFGGN